MIDSGAAIFRAVGDSVAGDALFSQKKNQVPTEYVGQCKAGLERNK